MKSLNSNKGQATLEAMLILTFLVSLGFITSKVFKSNNVLANMISRPWSYISGMAESGVWMKAENAKKYHPGHLDRHFTAADL